MRCVVLFLLVVLLSCTAVQASIQQDFLDLMNAERQSHGLSALAMNDKLQSVATVHSQDMVDKDYFNHTSLDGTSFSARINQAGYSYKAIGENIALHTGAPDAKKVFYMWKNSPGHYSSMMNSGYTEIGLGVAIGDYSGYQAAMYTLDFGDPYQQSPAPQPIPIPPPVPQPIPSPSPSPQPVSVEIVTPSKTTIIGTMVTIQLKASTRGTITLYDKNRKLGSCISCSSMKRTLSMSQGLHNLKATFKERDGRSSEDTFDFVLQSLTRTST